MPRIPRKGDTVLFEHQSLWAQHLNPLVGKVRWRRKNKVRVVFRRPKGWDNIDLCLTDRTTNVRLAI